MVRQCFRNLRKKSTIISCYFSFLIPERNEYGKNYIRTGGYEIIAGHRRKRACEIAGLKTMPVIIKNLTDDESTVIKVDSNIQREEMLINEKAFAYKMKYEALKRQGK